MAGKSKRSRRQFLNAMAGAGAWIAATPYFVPATALGLGRRPAPSDRITLAAIGCGGKGRHNTGEFLKFDDVQVVAVCDVDARHAEQDRQQVNGRYQSEDCQLYHDFRTLLERDDIDAVHISTPDHWHALIALAAMQRGKDIYCEKPLTNSVAEAIAVRDTALQGGHILQTGSHERSTGDVRRGCEIVRSGRLGTLQRVEINMPFIDEWHHKLVLEWEGIPLPQPIPDGLDWDFWLGPAAVVPYHERRGHFWWRFILAHGGGEMTDRGAHIIDIAQLALDRDQTGPTRITARGKRMENSLYDAFVDYEFENEYADGLKMVGINQNPRGVRFIGSDGHLLIHVHGGQLEADPQDILETPIPSANSLGRSPGHHRNFIDCVKSRTQPLAGPEVGCRTATICHLNNIAMLTGREIRWDPQAESVVNDRDVDALIRPVFRAPWNSEFDAHSPGHGR